MRVIICTKKKKVFSSKSSFDAILTIQHIVYTDFSSTRHILTYIDELECQFEDKKIVKFKENFWERKG